MEPLVPAEVDLRDFGFMPLDVRRLLTSETWIEAADEPKVGHAAMCLWAESWHQVPAASLPDNDRVLARLAMCTAEEWKALRDKILAGWVKCSDGLLYHPVVAEKAMESWKAKCARRARTKAATEAREARKRGGNVDRDDHRDEERHVECHVERHVERHEQRHVERNEVRDVHQGTVKGQGQGQEEKLASLRSASPSAAPDGAPPAVASTAERLAQVTAEAIAAFNASPLTKAQGGNLPAVNASVGKAKRQAQVKRCLRVAREICKAATGSTLVTPEFWQGYFAAVAEDDFYSGRRQGGPGHEGYVPDFELLTREATMLRIFDRSEAAA